MARKTTAILVFLILLNSSATVMEASGLNEAMGIDPNPGAGQAMDAVIENAKQGFESNAGLGQTLYSLFAAGMSTVGLFFEGITAAPTMFQNLGAPNWLTAVIFGPMYLISTLELIYVGTGRRVAS